ncbi:MAG: tRNA (adenosine(37)-N6)-threonylcarbamoyltransferase complex ATPase subunit type 1 TsaE [Gammaproteobacteria bacterium]|jgi:tRNA threonylcarbamoyladenosine biosynthesis protein TsaE
MSAVEQFLADAHATEGFGARLADCCGAGLVVFLHGDLGAGKTTLVRGFLRAAGCTGPVRSPTYTLVEPYHARRGLIYHLDLYRLADPEELEWIGVRELFDGEQLCLIEWPERGAGFLPGPDLRVHLQIEHSGRRVRLESATRRGEAVLQCLE